MKKIIIGTIIFLTSAISANAQTDYCKDITKKVDEMKGHTTYRSPSMSSTNDLYIDKTFTEYGSSVDIAFFTTKSFADYNASGLYIKFDDGTILKYPANKALCSYMDSENGYLYNTGQNYDLDFDDEFKNFKTKKIVKFQIADKDIYITDDFATKFRAWVNCIDAIKK